MNVDPNGGSAKGKAIAVAGKWVIKGGKWVWQTTKSTGKWIWNKGKKMWQSTKKFFTPKKISTNIGSFKADKKEYILDPKHK